MAASTSTWSGNAELRKGEQLGWFQFGGSDIVLLCQDRNIHLGAVAEQRYRMGQRIGKVKR